MQPHRLDILYTIYIIKLLSNLIVSKRVYKLKFQMTQNFATEFIIFNNTNM